MIIIIIHPPLTKSFGLLIKYRNILSLISIPASITRTMANSTTPPSIVDIDTLYCKSTESITPPATVEIKEEEEEENDNSKTIVDEEFNTMFCKLMLANSTTPPSTVDIDTLYCKSAESTTPPATVEIKEEENDDSKTIVDEEYNIMLGQLFLGYSIHQQRMKAFPDHVFNQFGGWPDITLAVEEMKSQIWLMDMLTRNVKSILSINCGNAVCEDYFARELFPDLTSIIHTDINLPSDNRNRVVRKSALKAVRKYNPDLILCFMPSASANYEKVVPNMNCKYLIFLGSFKNYEYCDPDGKFILDIQRNMKLLRITTINKYMGMPYEHLAVFENRRPSQTESEEASQIYKRLEYGNVGVWKRKRLEINEKEEENDEEEKIDSIEKI